MIPPFGLEDVRVFFDEEATLLLELAALMSSAENAATEVGDGRLRSLGRCCCCSQVGTDCVEVLVRFAGAHILFN